MQMVQSVSTISDSVGAYMLVSGSVQVCTETDCNWDDYKSKGTSSTHKSRPYGQESFINRGTGNKFYLVLH